MFSFKYRTVAKFIVIATIVPLLVNMMSNDIYNALQKHSSLRMRLVLMTTVLIIFGVLYYFFIAVDHSKDKVSLLPVSLPSSQRPDVNCELGEPLVLQVLQEPPVAGHQYYFGYYLPCLGTGPAVQESISTPCPTSPPAEDYLSEDVARTSSSLTPPSAQEHFPEECDNAPGAQTTSPTEDFSSSPNPTSSLHNENELMLADVKSEGQEEAEGYVAAGSASTSTSTSFNTASPSVGGGPRSEHRSMQMFYEAYDPAWVLGRQPFAPKEERKPLPAIVKEDWGRREFTFGSPPIKIPWRPVKHFGETGSSSEGYTSGESEDEESSIQLKVPFCCEGCEEKIQSHLIEVEGVDSVRLDSEIERLTITGWMKPEDVLKEARTVMKRSDFWPMTEEKKNN